MSSLMLDNGVELYGTHEEGEGGIEYRISRSSPAQADLQLKAHVGPDARAGGRPARRAATRACDACATRWRASPQSACRPRRRSARRSAIPNCASTGSRPARCLHLARLGQVPGARALLHHRHPAGFFRRYLLEQLRPLVEEFGARLEVGVSGQEIPIPSSPRRATSSSIATCRSPSSPAISRRRCWPSVGDEIADGTWRSRRASRGRSRCSTRCAVDFSLRRLLHYTGTDWRTIQPWILFTNYQRYVDQFVAWAIAELARPGGAYTPARAAGRRDRRARRPGGDGRAAIAAAPWHRFQMPAYT
jgi:hypothetical protein